MTENTFFFDTYAFFEIIKANPKYIPYQEIFPVTTIFNLAELNYGLKRKTTEKHADTLTEKYSPFLISVTVQDIQKAMTFRRKHKKLSMPDVIGYTIAKRLGIKFLTGDEDFRHLPNVEFVKK